ncbi:MAG TPA: hypothetical protein VHO70_02045 [Chitinispirillaceae bacterium]|nr:hypothetical protein [Chitinispirillaceae bacterium]
MKKILLAVLVVSLFQIAHTEQEWATSSGSCFAKGDLNISAGLSVWWLGFYGTVDYAILDAVSLGGGIGYNGYSFNSYYRYNYLPIAVRGSFHPFNLKVLADKIGIRDKLDTYIGISTGWNIGWASKKRDDIPYLYSEPSVGGFLFRENIGARYYFAPNFYGYAEEGAGFGNFNFGIGLKL